MDRTTTAALVAVLRAQSNPKSGLVNKLQSLIIKPDDVARVLPIIEKMPKRSKDLFHARQEFVHDYVIPNIVGVQQSNGAYCCKQIVIVGAGYDVLSGVVGELALSFPEIRRSGIKVFEVDLPEIQQDKIDRIARINVGAEGRQYNDDMTVYVPCDLSKDSLHSCLTKAGFDCAQKSMFVWMGVTYYLTEDEVNTTLLEIETLTAERSMLLFDYAMPNNSKAASEAKEAITAKTGESYKFFANDVTSKLLSHAFLIEEEVSSLTMIERMHLPVYKDDVRLVRFVRAIKNRAMYNQIKEHMENEL